ncbi:MAG: 3-dehydroquinate synthase [Bacteroidales bacterium]
MQPLLITQNIEESLVQLFQGVSYDHVFILTDTNTEKYCLPLLPHSLRKRAKVISIQDGDRHKTIEALASVWAFLSNNHATRRSLLINLGGGMVTDLGGFAASTFKRGIAFVNLPTTLLAAVDASVGGKTGINFNGLKNEIGVFSSALYVILTTEFFHTLSHVELLSGYAEMIKHALIDSEETWNEVTAFDLETVAYEKLTHLLGNSVKIKERIVSSDPQEKGLRKALNLGHTFGHAFESMAMHENRDCPHGYAVAWGMICELYLSHVKKGFPIVKLREAVDFIKQYYGSFHFTCNDYETLYELMTHDKKNESAKINITMLSDIGEIQINQTADKEEIFQALDFFRECYGM